MMTNRARLRYGTPFGADALFREDIHSLLSNSASRSGPRLPDALCAVLLPQGRRLVFSPTGKRAPKKKKETRKRGRKNISFRVDCKFWAKEPTISEPKSLRPFPFLCAFFEHVEASTSPKLGFALCLYLDKLRLRRATPRRFWLSKNRLENGTLGSLF